MLFVSAAVWDSKTKKSYKMLASVFPPVDLFLGSYTFTALINPGFPKNNLDALTGEPRDKFIYCDICEIWVSRDKKTIHCSDCDICIEGHDHHCPWVTKCVGKNNSFSFKVFLVTLVFSFFYFSIILATVISFYKNKNKNFDSQLS